MNAIAMNKAVARRTYELLGARDIEGLRKIADPSFVDHTPDPGQGPGMDGLLEIVQMWFQEFPGISGLRHRVEDQVAEGDKVMTRYTWRGTHRGQMAGIAPTGKRVEVGGIEIYRVNGGKVTDVWRIEDNLSLMQQLGVVLELAEA
jgi:predicted ester cyclase